MKDRELKRENWPISREFRKKIPKEEKRNYYLDLYLNFRGDTDHKRFTE